VRLDTCPAEAPKLKRDVQVRALVAAVNHADRVLRAEAMRAGVRANPVRGNILIPKLHMTR